MRRSIWCRGGSSGADPMTLRGLYPPIEPYATGTLEVGEGAGHAVAEPGILDRLIRVTDGYAGKAHR